MKRISLLLITLFQTIDNIYTESCVGPNNVTGEIKPLVLCPRLLYAFTNTPRKSEDYLSNFILDLSLEPTVCCTPTINITKREDKNNYGKISLFENDYLHKSGYWFSNRDIPWVVAIGKKYSNTGSNLRCSGTIINQRYVITAAECVTPDNSNIQVLVKDASLRGYSVFHVEELIVHPFYNIIPGLNNIALLRLHESVYLRDINRRILFSNEMSNQGNTNDTLQSASWLNRISYDKISFHKLLSSESCQEQFKNANIMRLVTEYDICTESLNASKSTTPQNYELGSPIMYESSTHYLIGITSSSVENTAIPKLHTRVTKYQKWIEYNMRPYTKTCRIGNKISHCVSVAVCPEKIHQMADDNKDALGDYTSSQNECYDKRFHCCDTSQPHQEPPRLPYKSKTLINYSDCGISNNTFRNVNNKKIYNLPWLAEITAFNQKRSNEEKTLCGGVFLNNRYVLTTSECLDRAQYDWEYTVVRYAKTNKKISCGLSKCFDYDEADILQWIPHKFFTRTPNLNDIGLIILAETIPLSDLTWPICMQAPEEVSPKPGDTLYIYDLNSATFKTPYVIESTMISNADCQGIYKERNRTEIITTYHMCSMLKDNNNCHQALGGVIMFQKDNRWFVAGVGISLCEPGLPAIHTNAQNYLKWVENTIVENPCTTLGQKGECVLLHECAEYVSIMANPINYTLPYIKKLLCSEKNSRGLKVCCNRLEIPTRFQKVESLISGIRNLTKKGQESVKAFCGYQHPDDYMIHSHSETFIDEYPWLAVIFHKYPRESESRPVCGGSIIHPRYILTGAQCATNGTSSQVTGVRLGEFNIKNSTDCIMHGQYIGEECTTHKEFDIEELIPHPFYSSSFRGILHDIGLIRLAKKIIWTEYIRPICLPDLPNVPKPGDILYTTGFGKISGNDESSTAELKKRISTLLLAHKECKQRLTASHLNIRLSDFDMCTLDFLNNTAFTCPGDGGGPLMYNYKKQWFLVGIPSRGSRCGEGKPEMHTKVSSYLSWIRSNLRP